MRHEINRVVLNRIDDQLSKQTKPTLTTLLHKLGVKNVEETLYEWAWHRPKYDPAHIVTVWAEDVDIDQNGGWVTEFSLDPSCDPYYNADQVERERRRIEILRKLVQTDSDCKVILMINRRSREEEARGKAAEAECRVLDDELWHTEIGDGARRGTLRRGQRLSSKCAPTPDANWDETGVEVEIGANGRLRFPDQEMRNRVEKAAIEHAKKGYALHGHVESVETENLGYDLAVMDKLSGDLILKVEVKGSAGEEEVFFLTRNENREAHADPDRWRLVVVTDALHSPNLQEYRVHEMERTFEKSPLVWHCFPKRS